MLLTDTLKKIYSVTIDRSRFREVATRYTVFILPLFFWGRKPQWSGLLFVIAGVLIRSWAAGHLRKDQTMAKGGPYLLVRHPLYLGSCLLALGLIVSLHHWLVTLILGGITFLTYHHGIRHEEENLRRRFESYREYSELVGPLWPKWKGIKRLFAGKTDATSKFSFQQYLKNKEYECLLGVTAVFLFLWLGSRT